MGSLAVETKGGETDFQREIVRLAFNIGRCCETLERAGVYTGTLQQRWDDFLKPSFKVDHSYRRAFRDKMDGLAREAEHVVRTVRSGAGLSERTELAGRVDHLVAPPAKPAPLFGKTGAAGEPALPVLPGLDRDTQKAVDWLEGAAANLRVRMGWGAVETEVETVGEAGYLSGMMWLAGAIIGAGARLERAGVDTGNLAQRWHDIIEPFRAVEEIATVKAGRRRTAWRSFRHAMGNLAREAEHVARTVRSGAGLSERDEFASWGDQTTILDGLLKLNLADLKRYPLGPKLRQDLSSYLDRLDTELLAAGRDNRASSQRFKEDLRNLLLEAEALEATLADVLGHDDHVAPPANPAPLVKKTGAAGGPAQPVLPGLDPDTQDAVNLLEANAAALRVKNRFACG